MKRENSIALVGVVMFIVVGLFFIFTRKSEPIYTTCESFSTQQEAQEYFNKNNAVHLDGDKDGIACEDNELEVKTSILPSVQFLPPRQTPTYIEPTPATPTQVIKPTPTVAPTPQNTNTPEPTKEPTKEPTPTTTPTPTVTPSPTPRGILNICIPPILC